MIIDKYLPVFDFASEHSIEIDAAPEAIYAAVLSVNLRESFLIRTLFALRGLPRSFGTLSGFLGSGFLMLEEKPHQEMVIGLVAQPWKPNAKARQLTTDEFMRFNEAGYVKVAWNFHLANALDSGTAVSTRTRIKGTDKRSSRLFSFYWFFVSYFSGVVRKEMLRLIKRKCEGTRKGQKALKQYSTGKG